jgi:7,8-dihydropterin-6-yl-methyl-4-(beta-D-ribofuranosyl)aminobenzene 5'-phosphate synthase
MKRQHRIRITLLAENTAQGEGIIGEHGLAVWIEIGGRHVLFDTGQGPALQHNAEAMGIDLSQTDAIVVSHGHYDHVGGLEWMLRKAPGAALHLHPRATEPKFSGSGEDDTAHRVSIPFVETGEFKTTDRRIVSSRDAHEVVPGIRVTGEIPRNNDFEDTGGPFFLDEAMTRPDPLLDDQALFMPTPAGMVVILGCAHAGVVNTLDHIEAITMERSAIRLLLGGLHLHRASPHRMSETISSLSARQVEMAVFCHCTGPRAVCELQQNLPGRCANGHAGMVLEL